MSHYKWLEANLNDFWLRVFGKNLEDTMCAGIIGAHGDKAYCYRRDWEHEGIHFYHGVALFLLTYTKEIGDTPKHESCQWVIDNYAKYKDKLPPVYRCCWYDTKEKVFSDSWWEYEHPQFVLDSFLKDNPELKLLKYICESDFDFQIPNTALEGI